MKLLCLVAVVALASAKIGLQMEGDMSIKLNVNHAEMVVKMVLANLTETKKILPPVLQYTDTLAATHGLTLMRIGEMKDGWIMANAFAHFSWKAATLGWNPEDHGGVTKIRIPLLRMWYPDIVPFDGKMDLINLNLDQQVVIVSSDGSAMWIPNVLLKFPCGPDAESDDPNVMNCTITFGSWTYSAQELNTTFSGAPGFDIGTVAPSRKYEVEATSGVRIVKKYDCCVEKYISLKYSLRVKRLPKPKHGRPGKSGSGEGSGSREQGSREQGSRERGSRERGSREQGGRSGRGPRPRDN